MMTYTLKISLKANQHNLFADGQLGYNEEGLLCLGCRLLWVCWTWRHSLAAVYIQRTMPETETEDARIPDWVLRPLPKDF